MGNKKQTNSENITQSTSKYARPIIKGIKYKKMLPKGCALVLEGGGTRGFYTAGVLEAFMDAGIMFPYIVGVSAGAANVLSYVSGQKGRNREIIEHYVSDHRYLSYRNLVKYRSLFGYDFIFNKIPKEHLFWDKDIFNETDTKLLTGAIDCGTGQTIWFEKEDIIKNLDVVRASCSVPFLSKIVNYKGYSLLDGGLGSPVPIDKSIADGNKFHVVVLTRNEGYVKPAFEHKYLLKLFYSKYPKFIEVMLKRHEIYQKQMTICEQLKKEGKAIIIRPQEPLVVNRTGRDVQKLLNLYDEGHIEGEMAIKILNTKI